MKLEVKVKKVLYTDSKSSYRIFKGQVLSSELDANEEKHRKALQRVMTFKGNMTYCSAGDTYLIDAKLKRDRQGMALYVNSAFLKKIELESELELYMINHIDGVGKKTAKTIIEALGMKAIDTIKSENGVDALIEVLGQGKKNLAQKIRAHVLHNANIFTIMEFLQIHGLPVKIANDILDEYGDDRLINLQSNPYFFIRCIDFKELDKIASKHHYLSSRDMNRISAGVIAIVNHNTRKKGDVYTHIDDIYQNLEHYINTNGCYEAITLTKKDIHDAMQYCIDQNLLSIENEEFLYISYLRNKENDVAYHIRRLNKQCKIIATKDILRHIEEFETENNVKVSEEQKEAVIKALQSNFSVLTGLPGAGKTFTINLILKIYNKIYPEAVVRPIAPTGKASRRMTEMTGIEAETIHRALKINEFTREIKNLQGDFVIIDEASMLDIYLAGTLFEHIEDGTKVLIVGDIEQLPSIGAGLILRDIIDSGVVPVTRLTKLFRQAEDSNIVKNAHAIANNILDFDWSKKDCVLWKSTNAVDLEAKLLISYKRMIQLGYSRDSIGILTPQNAGDLGTQSLNKLIQERFNMDAKSVIVNEAGDIIKEGDLVMQTVNNYDIEIFNGEVGQVLRIVDKKDDCGDVILDSEGKKEFIIEVDFNGRIIEYDKELCKQLDLAYAITIHKSQGSEYRAVINIIDSSHELMLNKNLVYTAWTRAKEQLVIIGDEETLNRAVQKQDAVSRLSNLKDKLNKKEFKKTQTVKLSNNAIDMEFTDFIDFDDDSELNIIGYDDDGTEIF